MGPLRATLTLNVVLVFSNVDSAETVFLGRLMVVASDFKEDLAGDDVLADLQFVGLVPGFHLL